MSRIKLLPDHLANQIAAGEVVERPAAVVKEFLDNALDAGASDIVVQVEGDGSRRIRVIDNGCGMDKDDVLLCLERHATSKIAPDLRAIEPGVVHSLGFRGEALPAIASVCRLAVSSRPAAAATGSRAEIHYGRLIKVHESGAPQGTVMEAAALFANLPARRKFLKSGRTELAHIEETVLAAALAWPETAFQLDHDGRTIRRLPAEDSMERVRRILGLTATDSLLELEGHAGACSLLGAIIPPDHPLAANSRLRLFVNKRPVRDRLLAAACSRGMQTFLRRGTRPAGVLFLELPPAEVDVNVHPAKLEVRFREPGPVQKLVEDALGRALGRMQEDLRPAIAPFLPRRESPEPAQKNPLTAQSLLPLPAAALVNQHILTEDQPAYHRPETAIPQLPPAAGDRQYTLSTPQPAGTALRLLGQLHGLYLLCENDEGLVVIDQHAAHERLLFEQLRGRYGQGACQSQGLVFPEVMELSPLDAALAAQHRKELARLGLDVEAFGDSAVTIRAVPTLLARLPAGEILALVLTEFRQGRKQGGETVLDGVFASMACKAAVKAGDRLQPAAMEALLAALRDSPVFSHCPHGRPSLRQISRQEIERWFHR